MRSTDRDDAQPLGPPVRPPPADAAAEAWEQVPDKPWLERERNSGRLRTRIPGNEAASMPPIWWWPVIPRP
jgi:hypothetical protein